MILGTKFSLITTPRIRRQSEICSPSSKQIDSSVIFKIGGGLAIVRISTKCWRLIDFTPFRSEFTQHTKRKGKKGKKRERINAYETLSVWKLTIVVMKFSRMRIDLITRHSVLPSPSSKQIDSRASFTAGGGLVIDFTSTKFCFLIDCTAVRACDCVLYKCVCVCFTFHVSHE